MPLCPVNQMRPLPSKAAVLRLAYDVLPEGSGHVLIALLAGSTRTMAFWPPSVNHGAPSGPTMTPCGAEFVPSAMRSTAPLVGFSFPAMP